MLNSMSSSSQEQMQARINALVKDTLAEIRTCGADELPDPVMPFLNEQQIADFKKNGYVRIPKLFSKKTAEEVEKCVLDLAKQDNPSGTDDLDKLADHKDFIEGFFRPTQFLTGAPALDMNTPELFRSLDDLLGESAYWKWHLKKHGLFTMTIPGYFKKPWAAPTYSGSWHIDNGARYEETYSLESGRCACVPAFLITDVLPEGGATACIPGSHKVMAALMRRLGHITYEQMRAICEVLASSAPRIDTLHGEAGDVVIMHAYMIHSPTGNTEQTTRIMSNSALGLKRSRSYDPYSATLSPSEQAIADVVYGLEPKGVFGSRLALKILTALRPLRKRFSNHPTWDNDSVNSPKKLLLLTVIALQAGLAWFALGRYGIKRFQGMDDE